MTLEQLRVFVAVAERQHVTQAARALNLAQSAASHAITALEERHDTKLFNRVGRHIELTEAGQAFLAEARAVLARAEAAELALSEFGSLKRGTLSVEASQTIASYWLPRYLVAFRRAYPQIQIRLAIGNTAQVAASVESGAAELGFIEGAAENPHCTSTPVARDQLLVVVGPEHPWVGRTRLTPGEMREGEWVLREAGPAPDRSSRMPWRSSASTSASCASNWNCRPTKPSAPPLKPVWAQPPSRLRLLRRASRRACCIRWRFTFPNGISMFSAIASAIGAERQRRCWR